MPNRPKPTALKEVQGNPGKRKLNENEPQIEASIPDAPPHLSPYAVEEWGRVAAVMYRIGILSEIDMSTLASYCQLYGRWRDAEEQLAKVGMVHETTNGNLIQSPLVGIANTAAKDMCRYAIELGMTPAARSKVSALKRGGKDNGWSEF